MITNLSSPKSIEQLNENIKKDENELQDKKVEQYINNEKKSTKENEDLKSLIMNWNDYSKYVKRYVDQIQNLTTLGTKSFTYESNILIEQFNSDFIDFFSTDKTSLTCKTDEIWAICPTSEPVTIKVISKKKKKEFTIDTKGEVALLKYDKQTKYEITGGQIKKLKISYDHDVIPNNEIFMSKILNYYNNFNSISAKVDNDDKEKFNYSKIVEKIGRVKVYFGTNTFDEFKEKLNSLDKYCKSFNIDKFYDNSSILDDINNELNDLDKYSHIIFQDKNDIPHHTTKFISDNLTNLISSSKKLIKSNFELFSDDFRKKYDFFPNEKGIFQKQSLHKSSKFELKIDPNKNKPEVNMNKVEASDCLLVPSIFKNGENITVTIKEININIENLLFGVDITPLQIRLCNFTNKEIMCNFSQNDTKLPLPNYRNEVGFLIIEIPVELFCKNAVDYYDNNELTNDIIDVKKSFIFDGTISLSTRTNPHSTCQIKYSISLHYISLTTFIQIQNNHYFAIKDGRAQIVPFITAPKKQLLFQKLLCREVKNSFLADTISELNDNMAEKPEYRSNKDRENQKACNIITVFSESKLENSYLSMNYIFGLSKDKKIPVELKINTNPPKNNLFLAIFSDPDKDFVDRNGIVNIGNISRKVYFFVGYLNIGETPIKLSDVILNTENSNIYTKYDINDNNVIKPNEYGCFISFFDAKYYGKASKKSNKVKASIKVIIDKMYQEIDFMYQINVINIEKNKNIKYVNNFPISYYHNDQFIESNKEKIGKEDLFWENENQIVVSPFCFNFYNKTKSIPIVNYEGNGSFSSITDNSKTEYDALEITNKYAFKIKRSIEDKNDLNLDSEKQHIYLFGRLNEDPDSFFPLFYPNHKKEPLFDARKCEPNYIYSTFYNFYYDLLDKTDKKQSYGQSLEAFFRNSTPSNNYSIIINKIGQNLNLINFNNAISAIASFTNSPNLRNHYNESLKRYPDEQVYQFISFVSALNELIYSRYEFLRSINFYIILPIKYDKIENQKQKMLEKLTMKESEMDTCKYINDFHVQVKEINDFEVNNCNKFKDNEFTIAPIVKWTECQGLKESNIEEYNKCKNSDYSMKSEINSVQNIISSSDSSLNKIERIDFPQTISIKSLYELFKKILSSTNVLPFFIYSLRQNYYSLDEAKNQLIQIITVFNWIRDSSFCFPFTSFKTYFEPAFDAMIARLKKAKITISRFDYKSTITNDFENFVEKPSPLAINMIIPNFTQPGIQNIASQNKTDIISTQRIKTETKAKTTNTIIKPKPVISKTTKSKQYFYETKSNVHTSETAIPMIKKVVFEEINENTKEIADIDFIQYLIQEMITNRENLYCKFEYKPSETARQISESIQNNKSIGIHNLRIDSFVEASARLSNVLIDHISKQINEQDYRDNLLYSKDSTYASVLVDCTSTFQLEQKSALVTLTIALGNALTAIKIPYSIILFCESEFQIILKQVDESHDLIHFEKLLDTITIRRRMSDMPSAILMADAEIKPQDATRNNHSMFVLTDGLTDKLNFINEWRKTIFKNAKRSIMFYFLDILTNQTDQDRVYPIWHNFQSSANNNSVVFSNASSIYNGDSIFIEPFINNISRFIGESEPDKQLLLPILASPINKAPKEFLENIVNNIKQAVVDEEKFFAQMTFSKEIENHFTEIELNLLQPNPLESFTTAIEEINPELIYKFLSDLISLEHSFFDPSILQEIGTLIFPPNKPSQYIPSENGNIFFFPGLMKFILTQGQDSKIFLEKKAGLIRSHSVFVLIDNSSSCFNSSTISHSFQTVFTLLYPLSKIDIPSLNIVMTTSEGPVVLCSEKSTMMALDNNSTFWVSLFSNLSKPNSIRSHFYAALISIYQMRIQQKTASSVLFVLTDGCYSFCERNEFNAIFESLKAMNTIPITIGIGMNPSFVRLMTEKAIWAQNPKLIWPAILYLFGKEAKSFDTIKNCFSISQFTNDKVNKLEEYLNSPNKMFPELFDKLNHIVRKAATYQSFYNKDQSNNARTIYSQNSSESKNGNVESSTMTSERALIKGKNALGKEYDLGKKDYYKGVKLLIVMCWDNTCSDAENPLLSEEVLKKGVQNNGICVINALKYFAIETNIVKNYFDAIRELKSGLYSQVWVICGRMDGSMPGSRDPDKNSSKYIDQFIDCVIMFWEKGGGLVFWTDNYPLTAEANKFLEKATFKVKNSLKHGFNNIKANFHIGGFYPGNQMMNRSQKLENCTFEGNSVTTVDGYQKELFNHELYEIFEGYTIASAIKGQERPDEWHNYTHWQLSFANEHDIFPFKPFSRSSSGGFSSLYYISPLDTENGDIVIDCGFTKLFFELTKQGIERYVKNIAVWMLQLEKKDIKYGSSKDARLVRPSPFEFTIQEVSSSFQFHKYKLEKTKVDLVFLIDGTGSMRYFIEAVRDCCNEISSECHDRFPGKGFRFGAVIYRDTIVTERNPGVQTKEQVEVCTLDEDIDEIKKFLGNVKAYGGGSDGPEDWVSGYDHLLHHMNWDNDSLKIVIHICDAQGHGTNFACDPKYSRFFYKIPEFSDKSSIEEDEEVYNEIQEIQDFQFTQLVKEAAQREIIFFCLNYHKKASYCFYKTRELYLSSGGPKFVIQNQYKNIVYNKYYKKKAENVEKQQNDKKFREQLIENVKDIVINAVDIAVAVGGQSENKYEEDCNNEFERDYKEFLKKCKKYKKNDKENHLRILDHENGGNKRDRGGRGGRGNRGGRGGRGSRGCRGGRGNIDRGIGKPNTP